MAETLRTILMYLKAMAEDLADCANDLEEILKSKEYMKYREDDSPKGENVPGVRHRHYKRTFYACGMN